MATIRLRIVNSLGEDLGDAKVERFESTSGKTDLARRFQHNEGSNIPYGEYFLRVHTTGFWSASRLVLVYQPEVLVIVGLDLGREAALSTLKCSGSIRNLLPSHGPVFVRLAGVYASVLMDAKVDSAGNFSLAGMPAGRYVLTAVQANQVLETRPVEIVPTSGPIEIELPRSN